LTQALWQPQAGIDERFQRKANGLELKNAFSLEAHWLELANAFSVKQTDWN
jgi:hypothetical protein